MTENNSNFKQQPRREVMLRYYITVKYFNVRHTANLNRFVKWLNKHAPKNNDNGGGLVCTTQISV